MSRAVIKARLSEVDIQELTDNLQSLIEDINNGVEHTTKELGEQSLMYMKKQYRTYGLRRHTSNLTLHAYNTRYNKGFIITPGNDIVAVFNEFGIGMRGAGTGDLADIYGYEYNIPSPHKGTIPDGAINMWGEEYCQSVTDDNTWWYFDDESKKWIWSQGYEGKNLFSSLADELNELAPLEYKTLIDGLVADYGRK